MRPSDQITRIIGEWSEKEERNSLDLGKISNPFSPFSLDSDTFSSCLWEILRDGKVPSHSSDPDLRLNIADALYRSTFSSSDAQNLASRGGGVEWEGEAIDEMLLGSALVSPKQNHDEVESGIKTLLLGPVIPNEKVDGGYSGIEIMVSEPPPKKPRKYQKEVIDLALDKIGRENRCNIVLPTGAGKTFCAIEVIVSMICNGEVDEVMWCTNRIQLLTQATDAIRRRWSTWEEGVILPTLTSVQNRTPAPEVFTSPIILFRTLQAAHRTDLIPNSSRLLVVDESHRHLDQSEKLAKETLKSGGRVMGLTATIRDEWQRMLDIFGSNVIPPSVKFSQGHRLDNSNFEEGGILARKIEHSGTTEGTLISDVARVNSLNLMLEIVLGRIEELGVKKSLVFVEGVDTAKLLAGRISGKGVPATHVSGKTGKRMRESIKNSLESGELRVIVNDELWKEGIDIPSIDSIFILRNTDRDSVTAEQMIGRGLRVPEGEEFSQTHIIWGY